MAGLSPSAAAEIAALTEQELAIELAKHRAPDIEEQYREIAKTVVPERILDTFMSAANVSAFVNEDGNLDEQRLRANLDVMKAAFSWEPVVVGDGAGGRAEAERRGYVTPQNLHNDRVEKLRRTGRSGQAAGLEEVERRYGSKGES